VKGCQKSNEALLQFSGWEHAVPKSPAMELK